MRRRRLICVTMAAVLGLAGRPGWAGREFSVDLWDWTAPCADLGLFKRWVEDLKRIGVTRVEISAPWRAMEPERGRYDLSYIADRLAICKEAGLGMRVRINSYYAGATPAWYDGAIQLDKDGKRPLGSWVIPSINDDRLWETYGRMCTAIAAQFRGEDVYFNPFVGMHAELKWSDWWDYDEASLRKWREAIGARPRPEWLRRVVGDVALPEVPPVAGPTDGVPDTDPATLAHVAFREESYREALRKFVKAVRAGDPEAKVSVPLGESYRSQSAEIANLDYWGLSRGADQVVHSYDFFWHHKDPAWQAGAAVASFRGITGLPVQFEFDGPFLFEQLGYTTESVVALAREAMAAGAGLKAANYSGSAKMPGEWPALVKFGKLCAEAGEPVDPPANRTVLVFVSKWANYAYREKTQWLHEAQFGAWKMLRDAGVPVRIVCEDNLGEELGAYAGVYVACSPMGLMPGGDRERLEGLCARVPAVVEVVAIPPKGFLEEPRGDGVERGTVLELGWPLAFRWLHDKERGDADAALRRVVKHLRVERRR